MQKRLSQTAHDYMMVAMIKHLHQAGHQAIRADLPNYEAPKPIRWKGRDTSCIPDITSLKDRTRYFFEVETLDSIDDEHTRDQWTLFAAFARKCTGSFVIVVPEGAEAKARARCRQLEIEPCHIMTVAG